MTTSALPSTLEEEASVLAALMIVDGGYESVCSRLSAEHFSEPLFARMYAKIGSLADAGGAISVISVMHAMAGDPAYAELGGGRYWAELTADPLVFYALHSIDHIVTVARRRLLLESLAECTQSLSDIASDPGVSIAALESALAAAAASSVERRTYDIGTAFTQALEHLEAVERGDVASGVMAAGFDDWNDITGGMRPGDLIYLAARPSMGKTAVSLSVSWRTLMAGYGVMFVSREMDIVQLMPRLLADMLHDAGGKATFDEIRKGVVSADDKAILRELEASLQGKPLIIVDPDNFGAEQLSPLIRRHRTALERDGITLGLVVVDYLGLIDPPANKPNREQEVSAISKAMKSAARSNRVPVMVLSQLNRSVEQREDKRPMLSDLRDSGSLEQDADIVIFLHREEYYLQRSEPDPADVKKRPAWEESMRAARDRIDIYSAKNRQGDLCRRKAWFLGRHQAVRNHDHYQQSWGER